MRYGHILLCKTNVCEFIMYNRCIQVNERPHHIRYRISLSGRVQRATLLVAAESLSTPTQLDRARRERERYTKCVCVCVSEGEESGETNLLGVHYIK